MNINKNKFVYYFIKIITRFENIILNLVAYILFCKASNKVEKVLILKSARFGDFIISIPAIKKIRERYPEAYIMLLCTDSTMKQISLNTGKPEWFDFVDHLIDEKLFIKGYEILTKKNISLARAAMRKINPDVSFILDPPGAGLINKLRKILYLRIIGVRKKVYGLNIFYDFNIKSLRKAYFELGITQNAVWGPLGAVCEMENVSADFPGYSLNINMDKVSDTVKNIHDENVVIIFPGAGFPFKLWPVEKYADLINKLKYKYPVLNFYLIGGSDDSYECDVISRLSCDAVRCNFCGKLNLMETAFLLRRAKLYIGNDSGPSHLSAALGTPTIVIEHGVDYPNHWTPYNPGNVYAIRKEMDCQYCCVYPVCPTGTLKCIKGIEVYEVEKIADKIINYQANLRQH